MPPKKKPPKKKPMDVYDVHEQGFEGKPTLIVCRSDPRPCPLLGLCNILLLRHGGTGVLDTVKWSDGSRFVSLKKLHAFVLDHFTALYSEKVRTGIMSEQQRNELVMEYKTQLDDLRSNTGVCQHFRSINHFVSKREASKDLFSSLGVALRHALLPDPIKDTPTYNAVKEESCATLFAELSEYEAGCEEGSQYEQSYHDKMSLVKKFVVEGPEFTSYGLDCLCEEVAEKELFILVINMDYHVVCKKDGELYLLATEEDMLVKYPDLMWLGLDKNFDVDNPLKTERKLTKTFSPVNENWASVSNQLLEELEEEKRPKRETEEAVSEEKAEMETTCVQTKVDTNDSQDVAVQDSCERQKAAELKRPKIVVERRFLRFLHRQIVSFKKFTSSYVMFKVYNFQGQEFSSTSYLGRLMAKGFLVFIFGVHKSGFSWNGDLKEEDMFVELEVVDGSFVGAINCFITLTANKDFKKEHGKADLEKYVQILFPFYLCKRFKELPRYFLSFEADIADMPDSNDPSEKLEKFHKYMSHHFFAMAPLARSTLVSDTYGIGDSEIVHADRNKPKPRYGELDIELPHELIKSFQNLSFPDPLNQIFLGSRVETHTTESNRWTCWDVIELGRHSKQHLMNNTQVNGVQQMQDPVIIDLILEEDLRGLLTQAIKSMIQNNKFDGRFASTWDQFRGTEPEDGEARIPLLCTDEEVGMTEEPGI